MMTIKQIYDLAIKLGIEHDLRGRDTVRKNLKRTRERYERLTPAQKKEFDLEKLTNPFSDTRISVGKPDTPVRRVMVGIDIDAAELMIAKHLSEHQAKPIDLVMSHHPQGLALAGLDEVMHMQAEVLALYGVPINIAESLLEVRISEVSRGISPGNHYKSVDAARNLGLNLMCVHTPSDNLVASFVSKIIKREKPEYVSDLIALLKKIPEYIEAVKRKAGPRIFAGSEEHRCGKIALTEITGGTEGSPKIYEKMSQAGIGTVVGMHMSEEHKKEAEKAHINAIIAGHMSSDSIGMNLFLDELEKRGIEIIPCSGLIRVSRVKKQRVKSK